MARVELSYQERIKELEQEKHDLKERLWEVTIANITMINITMMNITMINITMINKTMINIAMSNITMINITTINIAMTILPQMEERSQQVGAQREEMKTITELVGKLEQVPVFVCFVLSNFSFGLFILRQQ